MSRTIPDEFALVEQRGPVGNGQPLPQLVGNHDDRTALVGQRTNGLAHAKGGLAIKTCGRLIKDHDRHVPGHHIGNARQPCLPARERIDGRIPKPLRYAQVRQDAPGNLAGDLSGHAGMFRSKGNVFEHRGPQELIFRPLEAESNHARPYGIKRTLAAANPHLSPIRLQNARENARERRLARPRGPGHKQHFPRRHLKAYARQEPVPIEGNIHAACDQTCGGGFRNRACREPSTRLRGCVVRTVAASCST